jgi:hypothetical protein
MVSGITPCARECKWIVYFGETPKQGRAAGTPSQRVGAGASDTASWPLPLPAAASFERKHPTRTNHVKGDGCNSHIDARLCLAV